MARARKKVAILTAGLLLAACTGATAKAASLGAAIDSGVELRRQQEQMERLRLESELKEQREAKKNDSEVVRQAPEKDLEEKRFLLQAVDFDESEIISPKMRDEIVEAYLEREVTLLDLYEIVEKLNEIYKEHGFITCMAYLPPQTIHKGHVHIGLFEGRVGEVEIAGVANTRSGYIKNRMPLKEGSVPRYQDMDDAIRLFNATNDMTLHLTLKAGEKHGTTDFVLTAKEPPNDAFTFYGDNSGSQTTGRFRASVYYTNPSLFRGRDRLTLGFLRAKGLTSFTAGYSYPVGERGTRLEFSYNMNLTKVTGGQYYKWGIPVTGHATALQIALLHPLSVTSHMKADAAIILGRQHSVTDLVLPSLINDTFREVTAALSITHYGRGTAFYHRHALTYGHWQNGSVSKIAKPSRRYAFYAFNGIYQMGAEHGQLFMLRTNLQISKTNDIRPSKQFFLGGAYSVRGYKENLLGAPSGFSCSAEYAVPILKKPAISLYGFLDYGALWGAKELARHHVMLSTGIGVRARLKENMSLDMAAGVPLYRTVGHSSAPEQVDKVRLHMSFNAQF